jgi:hypothetical protein
MQTGELHFLPLRGCMVFGRGRSIELC